MDSVDTVVWKPIDGFYGFYEVSSAGEIRSIDRVVIGPYGLKHNLKGKIRKQNLNGSGYLCVWLSKEGHGVAVRVHRAVASAFIGKCPEGQEVRHKDGNKTNNHASNLEYGTRSDNQLDKRRHGTANRCQRHHSIKLTEEQAREIKFKLIPSGIPKSEIARKFGLSFGSVRDISTGRNWGWLS